METFFWCAFVLWLVFAVTWAAELGFRSEQHESFDDGPYRVDSEFIDWDDG
jgi:hypothetical protein